MPWAAPAPMPVDQPYRVIISRPQALITVFDADQAGVFTKNTKMVMSTCA